MAADRAAIGISRAAMSHIEANRNRPTLWLLLEISKGLGVKLESVLAEARQAVTR